MIVLGSFLIMLAVGFAAMRDGLLYAFGLFFSTLAAIFVSLALWPVTSTELESTLRGGTLDSLEDVLPTLVIFVLTLIGLRFTINYIIKDWEIRVADIANKGGAFFFGLATGYYLSGFLVILLQMIPWHEKFLGFEPEKDGIPKRMFPADGTILRMLKKLNQGSLNPNSIQGELQENSITYFERYFALHKRMTDNRDVLNFEMYPPPPPDPNAPKNPEAKPTVPNGGENNPAPGVPLNPIPGLIPGSGAEKTPNPAEKKSNGNKDAPPAEPSDPPRAEPFQADPPK